MYYTLTEVATKYKIPAGPNRLRFIEHALDIAITYPNPDNVNYGSPYDRLINDTTAESVVTSWYYKTLGLSPATLDKKERIAAERIAEFLYDYVADSTVHVAVDEQEEISNVESAIDPRWFDDIWNDQLRPMALDYLAEIVKRKNRK